MDSKYHSEKRISICALIISIISIVIALVFSIRGWDIETKLNKLHIEPQVDCYLVRRIDKKSLEFYLRNTSPIPLVNLSVAHRYFVYFSKSNAYHVDMPASSSILNTPGQNWLFQQELTPNESVGKREFQILSQLEAYEGRATIVIAAIFDITFYRETDMKQFSNKAIFFLDNEKIYSYRNALDQDHLMEPIRQLAAFESRIRGIPEMPSGGSRLYQKAD
jgi:hypothetical protein